MTLEHYSQDQDFTIQGHWWRPGGHHRPAGDLIFANERIQLKLLGAFDDAEGEHPFNRKMAVMEMPIIYGESAKGTRITLLNSFYTNWKPAVNFRSKLAVPVQASVLHCNTMLIGRHSQHEDEECFKRCYLTIPNLDRWLDDRPFQFDFEDATEFVGVKYKMPPTRSYDLPDRLGEFIFSPSVIPPVTPWDDVTITNRTRVQIRFEKPKSFSQIMTIVENINRLFTLLMGRVVQATRTRLVGVGESLADGCEVYLPKERLEQPQMNPWEFSFRYPEISQWFQDILKSWFGQSNEIKHALDLVFSSLQKPGRFLETKFLPFVQAVEVYSRAVNPGRLVEKSVYKPIRMQIENAIPKSIDPELEEAIKRKLQYANERTLRERFLKILDELQTETKSLFCKNEKDFVRGVVETRNHLTHYSGSSKNVLSDAGLYWATVKLQTLMKVLLLKRLGIPEKELVNLLSQNDSINGERQAWQNVPECG
ncbi:HEPN domain-containing protein [Symmachiella dynata]|uniref:ApeA N-terminal domain 1-containing protein n=1 Tax=Symmachiella dynata TaxID=2527995 RepID=UPI0030ED9E2F